MSNNISSRGVNENKKSVSFGPNEEYQIETSSDMGVETWYSKEELTSFRRTAKLELRTRLQSHQDDDDEDSFRGLEWYTPARRKERRLYQEMFAILKIREMLSDMASMSDVAVNRAQNLGASDADSARTIYGEYEILAGKCGQAVVNMRLKSHLRSIEKRRRHASAA